MSESLLVDPDALQKFAAAVFRAAGVPSVQAEDAASVLVWASLRGVDTHGVRNLIMYVRHIDDGVITPDAAFTVEHETPFSARVDGGSGLGMAASLWGMRLAMAKAAASGMGLVSMRNSQHFGAAGYYAAMPLSQDMIGVALTGRFMPLGERIGIVPTFGAMPMLSTNPIAVGVPTAEEPTYLLDMATSITPWNRTRLYHEVGKAMPEGWGLDDDGLPTTDPTRINRLFPLGGTYAMGGHKGYGLAMVVEILTGVLSSAWTDALDEHTPSYDGYGQKGESHFFGAIRIDAFRAPDDFKRSMDAMIRALHASPKEAGQERIYVAGEIEHETELERRYNGIPIAPYVQDALTVLATRFELQRPF